MHGSDGAGTKSRKARRHVVLVNPTITKPRSAKFPLAILNIAAALEGRYESTLIDGNADLNFISTVLRTIEATPTDLMGVSVMGGPQLRSAIALSRAVRARFPRIPIVWGGHFPTLCADACLAMPYIDYAVRGQGEETLIELLDALAAGAPSLGAVAGLTWRRDGVVVHNFRRAFSTASHARTLPYQRLGDPRRYLSKTYLGRRTSGYQAALGCRFRCTFCGVAAMFRGKTALPAAPRLEQDLDYLTERLGVDSLLFYDNNFFDREADTVPVLEVLSKRGLPWWCFARADALVGLSASSWSLVRRSRLRMAYIGAESPSDWLLHDARKGTRADQTLEAVERCRANNVIPELSFMLAPPQDPEGETERTFEYIRHIKRIHPATEIMLYVYAPLPPAAGVRDPHVERAVASLRDSTGAPLVFPATAEGWAESPWLAYWCHTDTPWLTERLRRRIRDFTTVLGCRFPTITDVRSPPWGKSALRALASWRYGLRRYGGPWELEAARRLVRLWDPRLAGL
ncbi:MAG: B12-binding domain-containing radical SAM protein [Gammaproteobacteria bacterium]|nr:B12-binding domain-containing radical SAM protein [Gammaproteobacteria bacterium]MDE2262528.1 B12-binding domain-containing radical SAM protein [Gammaproteobacteria bacterium]